MFHEQGIPEGNVLHFQLCSKDHMFCMKLNDIGGGTQLSLFTCCLQCEDLLSSGLSMAKNSFCKGLQPRKDT